MKYIFSMVVLLLLTSFSNSVLAQDYQYKTYLDQLFRETVKKNASYVRELTMVDERESLYTGVVWSMKGKKKMEGNYFFKATEIIEHGKFTYYFPNGQIESKGMYEKGIKVGAWKRFTADGSSRADRFYDPSTADLIRNSMGGN